MTLINMAIALFIVLLFIVMILRAFYYTFVLKSDPIKSIIPKLNWYHNQIQEDEQNKIIQDLS